MDERAYALAAAVEDEHWWFRGRRAIVGAVLDRYTPARGRPLAVLEVGCGSGGNLDLLARYGVVCAVEGDPAARARAAGRGLARVEGGWLPDRLPFGDARFDLIALFDVLEHVEQDGEAMATLRERLAPGGLLAITVPAYPWLWSHHDELSHHRRRYTLSALAKLLGAQGLSIVYATHFNTLLFPLAAGYVTVGRWFPKASSAALRLPRQPLNQALSAVFQLEAALVPRFRLPYGVSILACARVGGEPWAPPAVMATQANA